MALSFFLASCAEMKPVPPKLEKVPNANATDRETLVRKTSANVRGKRIAVEVKYRDFAEQDKGRHTSWRGTDGGIPEIVVESFKVTSDGRELFIPKEMYSDFGEPVKGGGFLDIYMTSEGFAVKYSGGDGAGSYAGTFYFVDDRFDALLMGNLGMGGTKGSPRVVWVETWRKTPSCATER